MRPGTRFSLRQLLRVILLINSPAAGQPHTCTNYKNCSAGHPTVYCVFDGAHGWEPKDPGQSTSWTAKEAWAFITQF